MYNDKYNLFFDPSGLHFCSEQIEEMYELRCYDLCQESLSRQKSDYEDLVQATRKIKRRGCKKTPLKRKPLRS